MPFERFDVVLARSAQLEEVHRRLRNDAFRSAVTAIAFGPRKSARA